MGIILGNMIAVYRKELQGYFASPLAYTIAGIFWLITGYFLITILLSGDGIVQQVATRDQMGITDPPIDVATLFLQNFLQLMASISLFILPMLSMGLYTEERKRGTLELLATSPITNWVVALGKLLGVVTFYVTMVLPLMALEFLAVNLSNPPFPMTILILGHLGLVLMAVGILSLGMFISSLTDSTILSAILTFGLVLFLWIVDLIGNNIGGSWGDAISHLSLVKNYTNLVKGILDTSSLIIFGSYIVLGIFLTAQSIDSLRFQQRS